MNIPKLISTRQVSHVNAFNQGPRITEVQTVEVDGNLFKVSIWTQSGQVVRVDAPVAINS